MSAEMQRQAKNARPIKKQVWRPKSRFTALPRPLFEHIMSFLVGEYRIATQRMGFSVPEDTKDGPKSVTERVSKGDSKRETKGDLKSGGKASTQGETHEKPKFVIRLNHNVISAAARVSKRFANFASGWSIPVGKITALGAMAKRDLRIRHYLLSRSISCKEWIEFRIKRGEDIDNRYTCCIDLINAFRTDGKDVVVINITHDIRYVNSDSLLTEEEGTEEGTVHWWPSKGRLDVVDPSLLGNYSHEDNEILNEQRRILACVKRQLFSDPNPVWDMDDMPMLETGMIEAMAERAAKGRALEAERVTKRRMPARSSSER